MSFRPEGEAQWFTGETVNVSRSGVLFNAERIVERDTQLEIVLNMQVFQVPNTANIVCRGHVVRVESPTEADSRTSIAIAMTNHTFVRSSDLPTP